MPLGGDHVQSMLRGADHSGQALPCCFLGAGEIYDQAVAPCSGHGAGRVDISKEIRRTMRVRDGEPPQTALINWQKFCFAMDDLAKRHGWEQYIGIGSAGKLLSLFLLASANAQGAVPYFS